MINSVIIIYPLVSQEIFLIIYFNLENMFLLVIVIFFFWLLQKEFLDHLKKALTSTKTLTEIAAVVCVNLCKVATYMKPEDNSVLCFLVVEILNELKVHASYGTAIFIV